MFARLLLAVSRWPESRPAIAATTQIALACQAEVLVLHVRERDRARGVVWDVIHPSEAVELIGAAVYQLTRRGISARGIVRMALAGRAAEEIEAVARDERIDLIVVGSRRLSCLTGFVQRSVNHRLIRLADRPVLIATEARRRQLQPSRSVEARNAKSR
jgi:nucleotide-binding universal stress UspA family protein